MTQAAAKTGAGQTSIIAIEQLFPADQRIIFDDLARSTLPLGARALVVHAACMDQGFDGWSDRGRLSWSLG